jgi:hypothetical protein
MSSANAKRIRATPNQFIGRTTISLSHRYPEILPWNSADLRLFCPLYSTMR